MWCLSRKHIHISDVSINPLLSWQLRPEILTGPKTGYSINFFFKYLIIPILP